MDCKIDGCIRKVVATGLCHRHYEEERKRHAPPCNIEGCGKPSERAGMCHAHYRAQKLAVAPLCTVPGCGRHQNANGYCTTHNKRIERYGSLEADARAHDRGARRTHQLYESWRWFIRSSRICREWRDDFWAMVAVIGERPSPQHNVIRPDDSKLLGPDNWAWREAAFSGEDKKTYARLWRARNPEASRGHHLKKYFKIGLDDYSRMLDEQGGVCAICKRNESARAPGQTTSRHLAVDHCHSTGKIRGLLCTACNLIVGKVDASGPDLIENLYAYLHGRQ
jgi:hypothetical protein